ncbi:MAG: ribonuclease HIII [Candidatus Gastranaerophilales bacterium]|nr:ribonuclease HIII [Candidatus Gastranaerophilales bacterium]
MNIYTNKFSPKQFEKIKQFFKEAVFSDLQYGQWRAEKNGYNACLYNSGKFVLQGKEVSSVASDFEQFMGISTIEQKTLLSVSNELDLSFEEYIGTDESGKGDLFGPLVIAGVYTDKNLAQKFEELGVKDSKKLDDKTITKLSAHIRNSAPHSVVVIMPEKYNELYNSFKNLNKLLAWGHARAIENVLNKQSCKYAISDKFGDEALIKNALMKNGQTITLEQRTKGEAYTAVAAASIIARAEFVKRCNELKNKYGFDFPKGVSDKVVSIGHDFVKKYGKENLKYVAKMHFKTINSL